MKMNPGGQMWCMMLLALVLAWTPGARADDTQWLDFPAGLTYVLGEHEHKLSARIPVTQRDGVELKDVRIRRRDVAAANGRPSRLAQVLSIQWEPSTAAQGPALLAEADAKDLVPGNYTLVIEFEYTKPTPADTGKATPAEKQADRPAAAPQKQVQAVSFILQRPAPQVLSLRPVRVWQELGWPFCTSSTPGRLDLVEEGGVTSVQGLSVTDVRSVTGVPTPETGRLVINLPAVLEPRGQVSVEVLPEGEFPVGKTTGKLIVRSSDAPPVSVEYEVTATRTPVLIAICALLGAGLGLLVRNYLEKRKQRAKALAAASATLKTLQDACAHIPDQDFVDEVGLAAGELEKESESEAPEITAAVTKAQQALLAARNKLDARRKALSDAIVPRHNLLYRRLWELPTDSAALLEAARSHAEVVINLAKSQDIGAAQKLMDGPLADTCIKLARETNRWRADAAKYLDAVAATPPVCTQQVITLLRQKVTEWKEQFGKYTSYTAVDNIMLEQELSTTYDGFQRARICARDLGAEGGKFSEWLRITLVPPAPSDLIDECKAISSRHSQEMVADLDKPGSNADKPAVRGQAQRQALERALVSVFAPLPKSVVELLDGGDWEGAVRETRKLAAADDDQRSRVKAFAMEGAARSPLAPEPSSGAAPQLARWSAKGASEPLGPSFALAGSGAERASFQRAERSAALWQSLIFAVLFIIVVYLTYGDQWVGTFREMGIIILWAFGIDLTAEVLGPLFKKAAP